MTWSGPAVWGESLVPSSSMGLVQRSVRYAPSHRLQALRMCGCSCSAGFSSTSLLCPGSGNFAVASTAHHAVWIVRAIAYRSGWLDSDVMTSQPFHVKRCLQTYNTCSLCVLWVTLRHTLQSLIFTPTQDPSAPVVQPQFRHTQCWREGNACDDGIQLCLGRQHCSQAARQCWCCP